MTISGPPSGCFELDAIGRAAIGGSGGGSLRTGGALAH
jgi:hypothetical protein